MTTSADFGYIPFSTHDPLQPIQTTTLLLNPTFQTTPRPPLPAEIIPTSPLGSTTSAPVNIQYLEQQIELLMKLLRISNDQRLHRHYVNYYQSTTSKNPLPPNAYYGKPTQNPLDFYFGLVAVKFFG